MGNRSEFGEGFFFRNARSSDNLFERWELEQMTETMMIKARKALHSHKYELIKFIHALDIGMIREYYGIRIHVLNALPAELDQFPNRGPRSDW